MKTPEEEIADLKYDLEKLRFAYESCKKAINRRYTYPEALQMAEAVRQKCLDVPNIYKAASEQIIAINIDELIPKKP